MIVINGVEMLDVQEAARRARRTPETIRRWVWTGRVRAVKEGNKLFLAASDIPRAGSEAEQGAGATGTSLAAWAERVEQTHAGGTAGATAQDLVLEDRAARADR